MLPALGEALVAQEEPPSSRQAEIRVVTRMALCMCVCVCVYVCVCVFGCKGPIAPESLVVTIASPPGHHRGIQKWGHRPWQHYQHGTLGVRGLLLLLRVHHHHHR